MTMILVMSSPTGSLNVKAVFHDHDKLSALNETDQSSNVVTKTDKKLFGVQQLYEAPHRLKNITSELKVCVVILEDKNASQRKRNDIVSNITKVILPAIVKVIGVLNDTGKNIAPIGSVKLIRDRNERKKQIQTVDTTNEQKSAGMQMLESYTTMSRAISIIPTEIKGHAINTTMCCRHLSHSQLPIKQASVHKA